MATVPTLDWTCAHCGNNETWQLVKAPADMQHTEARHGPDEAPTLDWTCSRCGTTETYMLVPMREPARAR